MSISSCFISENLLSKILWIVSSFFLVSSSYAQPDVIAEKNERLEFVQRLSHCAEDFEVTEDACAYAVRNITRCASRATGWCSGSAGGYKNCSVACKKGQTEGCINHDFHKNWIEQSPEVAGDCMNPGDIRIYRGHCHEFLYHEGFTSPDEIKENRIQCLHILIEQGFVSKETRIDAPNSAPRNQRIMAGDFHGHIEVVGEGSEHFYHFTKTTRPVDHQLELGRRRMFVSCLKPRAQSPLERMMGSPNIVEFIETPLKDNNKGSVTQ